MPADAVSMLKDDHKKVQELFQQFEEARGREEKKGIADNAIVELEAHTLLEEEIVYPAMRRVDSEELVDEAEEEHHVAMLLMEELMDMQPDDARYQAKFKVLAEAVRLHIKEEEKEMLPKLEKLGGEELMQMAERMTQRRQEFLQDFREREIMTGAGVEGAATPARAEQREAGPRGRGGGRGSRPASRSRAGQGRGSKSRSRRR